MEERGKLDHTIAHGVFVGPARSGKNSLMERLLGRMPSSVSPSTGVAESVVQVKVIQKSATFATNVEELTWTKMDYDDEAIKLMLINSKSTKNIVPYQTKEVKTLPTDDAVVLGETLESKSDITSVSESENERKKSHSSATQGSNSPLEIQPSSSQLHVPPQLPASCVPPIEILKEAVKNKGYEALKQHFETTWSLYLTNTGGQMEFQEVLPLLVSGPSMFFFTFRLDRDLHEYYTIEYELSDGKKSHPYTSTLSTIDGMLQTLASISAMGTFVYSGLHRREKPLQPKVFFVGTHKDQLDSNLADSHIAHIDQQLQKVIRSTTYYKDLVESASESRLIFTVNNFSESDSDFECIRLAVQHVVTRNEFKMTSPTHWLIFSLAIRKLNDRVISYDSCLEIARECRLSDSELDEALYFIHSKMGLIRYFPYEHIKSLVFIDPQFLFDKVTELIVGTFTFGKVTPYEREQFRHKGIFSLDKLSTQHQSSTIMSTFQFGKLLERLRIVAPLKVGNEMKYFLPCVLAHARKSDSHLLANDTPVPALHVSFECGCIPQGVCGTLIKYLMTNEMKTLIEWTLIPEKIFKNEVSFCVGPYDTIMIKIFPTHFEVTCIPSPSFPDDERDDCPVKGTCTVVLKAIDSGIKQILQDLNYMYDKTRHSFTFPCPADICNGCHPAQLKYIRGSPRSLYCNIQKKLLKLPANVHFWEPALLAINKEQNKASSHTPSPPPAKRARLAESSLSESHLSVLLCQLSKHATKWREIGTHLGFLSGELSNIETRPYITSSAPLSWLSAMLTDWFEWAPEDNRGSTSFATLEALKDALDQAGLGATARNLRVDTVTDMHLLAASRTGMHT